MSARLGFSDPDLTTPEHDDMVLWIKRKLQKDWNKWAEMHAENQKSEIDIHAYYFAWTDFTPHPGSLDDKWVRESMLDLIRSIDENPVATFTGFKVVLEKPIMNKNFIVGYADLSIAAQSYKLEVIAKYTTAGVKLPELKLIRSYNCPETFNLNIEVKPKIGSLGEVLRQIRTYQEYSGKWAIASPDRRFEKEIEEQGIMFLPIPPNYNQPTKEEFPSF